MENNIEGWHVATITRVTGRWNVKRDDKEFDEADITYTTLEGIVVEQTYKVEVGKPNAGTKLGDVIEVMFGSTPEIDTVDLIGQLGKPEALNTRLKINIGRDGGVVDVGVYASPRKSH
jgi:hypothetical protein